MGLLDDVSREHAANRVTVCIVQRWYTKLDSAKQAEVDEVLKSEYPAYTICRVLLRHFPGAFGERAFVRHMRGECCCVSEG